MGRRPVKPRGPADAAGEQNLWIKVNRLWFTPDEFEARFRDGESLSQRAKVEILNPLSALHNGRQVIEDMIKQKKPVSTILNAYERLNKFADKIIKEQYRPRANQVNSAEWPEVAGEARKKEIEWQNAQQEARRLARLEAAKDKTTYAPYEDYKPFED